MTVMRSLRPAARPTKTVSCGYDGCSGCYMCQHDAPTPPESNTSLTGLPGGLTPGKSYAEALTGSPSPGLTRDHSTGDVNPTRSVTNDNLSIQETQRDANGESNIPTRLFDTNHQPTLSTTEPSTNTTNVNRQRWTKDE